MNYNIPKNLTRVKSNTDSFRSPAYDIEGFALHGRPMKCKSDGIIYINDHPIVTQERGKKFFYMCYGCARSFESALDIEPTQARVLKEYGLGYFSDSTCEYDAVDCYQETLDQYLGRLKTEKTTNELENDMVATIREVGGEKGRTRVFTD